MSTALLTSTALTPAQYERKKTVQQKAEDVIYTLNHAITCLSITDLFVLGAVGNLYKKVTNKVLPGIHEHGDEYGPFNWIKDRLTGKHKDPEHVAKIKLENAAAHEAMHHAEHGAVGHHHSHGPMIHPESTGKQMLKKAWHNSKGWILSEAIGDLGAVPVTIVTQRLFPGLMTDLRNHMEPIIGKTFRKNTRRAAENWGAKHNLAADSQEVVDYAQELYDYEMRHMPQMAVWTLSSVALNWAAMRYLGKKAPEHFPEMTLKEFMIGKGLGAGITAGLVLGVRGFTPGGAHKWDQTVGKKVIVPVTKTVGGLFGVKKEDVDAFHKRNDVLEAKLEHKPATQIATGDAAQTRLQQAADVQTAL